MLVLDQLDNIYNLSVEATKTWFISFWRYSGLNPAIYLTHRIGHNGHAASFKMVLNLSNYSWFDHQTLPSKQWLNKLSSDSTYSLQRSINQCKGCIGCNCPIRGLDIVNSNTLGALPSFGVSVKSWSRNCPNCITMWVYLVSGRSSSGWFLCEIHLGFVKVRYCCPPLGSCLPSWYKRQIFIIT